MKSKPGRLRIAAAEILIKNGLPVCAENIVPAQGTWRHITHDVFKWEVHLPSSLDSEFYLIWLAVRLIQVRRDYDAVMHVGERATLLALALSDIADRTVSAFQAREHARRALEAAGIEIEEETE